METENTKPIINEHVGKSRDNDETPHLDVETRDINSIVVPSPIPLHETDADPKGPTHNPPSPDKESLSPTSSEEMQSPPIQTMSPSTPPGYDPSRIPTSIFSTKPTNPAEWSATSNESLFSIHMGNNSFSRDYAILFGKSGDVQDWNGSELPRLEEWTNNNNNNNNNNAIPKSCELISLPTVMESPRHEKEEVEAVMSSTTSYSPLLEKHDEVINSPTEVRKAPANPPTSPSPPRFSDDSGNSGNSFAFPVLVQGEGGKAESLKVVPEQPESQGQESKESANAAAPGTTRSWFSFLVCWPPRCC